jgi:N6-adenosine-specific RNA methylase IME4
MPTFGDGYMNSWRPDRCYGVIYADPPWSFRNFSEKGTGRNAVAHYPCLDVAQLAALDIASLAARDCILFLWATDPLLPQALQLIDAWGFRFKTVGFYWAKINKSADPECFSESAFFTGLGYWTRANVEQCLLATRGAPARMAKDVKRLIVAPRREHSRKPEQVHRRIERLACGPYIELFARQSQPGWDAWGNQVGLFDAGVVETRNRPSNMARRSQQHSFLLSAKAESVLSAKAES